MPTQQEIEQLLGRSLSPKESAAFETYLDIANRQLEAVLGYSLALSDEAVPRMYSGRTSYTSIITSPFSEITSIEYNGRSLTDGQYTIPESARPLKNEVVTNFLQREGDAIKITAKWGFSESLPGGVKLLLANMFDVVANGQATGGGDKVKSETTLSHSVTYDTNSSMDNFVKENSPLIDLYKYPKAGYVAAGRILWGDDDDLSGYNPHY